MGGFEKVGSKMNAQYWCKSIERSLKMGNEELRYKVQMPAAPACFARCKSCWNKKLKITAKKSLRTFGQHSAAVSYGYGNQKSIIASVKRLLTMDRRGLEELQCLKLVEASLGAAARSFS